MTCFDVRLRWGTHTVKDAGKAHCLPSAFQKNVLLSSRWAPKHGNHVTHKEPRAASAFLFPLYRYKPISLNNKPILQMPQGKRKVILLKHTEDVRTIVLSCSTVLPARVRTVLPAEAPQGHGLHCLSHGLLPLIPALSSYYTVAI